MFIPRPQVSNAPKKELVIILPYLGKMSQIVKTRLTKTINKDMKFCTLRVIIQANNRLRILLSLQRFCSRNITVKFDLSIFVRTLHGFLH